MSELQNRQGTLVSYIVGFVISIVLTVEAYLLVVHQTIPRWSLIFVLIGLALVQLFIQLLFFLHISEEPKPRWNLYTLLFAGLVVFIVVGGSLWIMQNLERYHGHAHGTPSDAEIIKDEGF